MLNKNSKINIMQIISSLKIGGAENQVIALSNFLDKKKFNVILCVLQKKDGPLRKQLSDVITVIEIGHRRRYFPLTLLKLIQSLRKYRIHVLHCHLYICGFWGRIAGLITRVPVMITTEHAKTLWKKKRHVWFERIANHFTDIKIAVDEDVRQLRINKEKTDPDKIVLIPNSIDVEEFNIPCEKIYQKKIEFGLEPDTMIVGTVGRLVEAKDYFTFLDAAYQVKKRINETRFMIVGEGILERELKDYANKLGLNNDVIFTGARMDVPEIMAIFDVYVISSLWEGLPVNLLEAMASRKAIIATDVGGIPETIEDNKDGLLIPTKNPTVLAEKIEFLLRNKNEMMRLGENAYLKVKVRYDIHSNIKKIEELYENLYKSYSVRRGRRKSNINELLS